MVIEARLIRMRYPGECLVCAKELGSGDRAWWNEERRFVACVTCSGHGDDSLETPLALAPLHIPVGWAHQSSQHRRMKELRQGDDTIRTAYASLGSLIWNVCDARSSTKVWGPDATGQRVVGEMLDALVAHGMIVLHDVRLPSERNKIDHVVIAPSGIHVIDSKHFPGDRVEVRRGGRFLANSARLHVGGRDSTQVVEHMGHQVRKIYAFTNDLPSAAEMTVTPIVCFVDANWRWPRHRLGLGSVEILWPKALMRLLTRSGPLGRYEIEELGCRLASRLVYDFGMSSPTERYVPEDDHDDVPDEDRPAESMPHTHRTYVTESVGPWL
jgi:hypothetical protein